MIRRLWSPAAFLSRAVTLWLVLPALALVGCLNIASESEPVSLFRLTAVTVSDSNATTKPLKLTLEVTANQMFDNQRLWVYNRDNKVQAFAGARWVMPLTDLVEQATTRSLERSGVAAIVDGVDAEAHLVLTLREFQAERGEQGERVRLALQAKLGDPDGGAHYRQFEVERAASLASAGRLAGAFDTAYATLMDEVAGWLIGTLDRGESG